MKKWLVIEPYVFVWSEQNGVLFYNHLNYDKVFFQQNPEKDVFFKMLSDFENLYCLEITPEIESNSQIACVINELTNKLMANIIWAEEENKPINVPPKLVLSKSIEKCELNGEEYYDLKVLGNIRELSVQLTGECNWECKHCDDYCHQFVHCKRNNSTLSVNELINLCAQASCLNIKKLNIFGGDLLSLLDRYDFTKQLNSLVGKLKIYHINILQVQIKKIIYILSKDIYSIFKISVDMTYGFKSENVTKVVDFLSEFKDRILWQFVVTDYLECEDLEAFLEEKELEYELKLFYNNNNSEFIDNNLLLEEKEITSLKIPLKKVFANSVINTEHFGKIIVSSSGNVYDNLNFEPIGTIHEPLDKLIHDIIKKGNSWRLTRNSEECSKCTYKFLCPPPDNLQIVRGTKKVCLL
jgi:pseudo-rSAM protein